MRTKRITILCLAGMAAFAILGGMLIYVATSNGPWGYSDPVAYIATARSLAKGLGPGYIEASGTFEYFTIQPPFYSVVLSGLALMGVNLVTGARWLNLLAFVFSIFLSGFIFLRYTRIPLLGLAASAMLALFPAAVEFFSSAYSEPLFILVFLVGAILLLEALKTGKLAWLVASAVVFGMLPLTRYGGMAMLASAGLTVLLFINGKTRRQLGRTLLFLLISALPVAAWLVWVYFVTSHNIGDRSVGVDWTGFAGKFQDFRGIFMDTVWKWLPFQSSGSLLRYRLRFILLGLGLVIVTMISLLAHRKLGKGSSQAGSNDGMTVFTLFGLSSLIYLIFLFTTYMFTMPTIDIDNRMLLPFYASTVVALLGAWSLWQAAWFRGWRNLLLLIPWSIVILFIAWYIPLTRDKVDLYRKGAGLTSTQWDTADIIRAVRDLPADQPVIANDWEVLLLWTERPVHGLWSTFPETPPMQVTPYGTDERDSTQSLFCRQGGALVIFSDFWPQFRERFPSISLSQTPELFSGLKVDGVYSRATIYTCPQKTK